MIQSTRAISLVLVSAVSVLGGYHALKPAQPDYNDQEWGDPSTRPAGSHYNSGGYHSTYYHRSYWGWGSGHSYGSSSFSSSGYHSSSSSHGTTHGGFGSTGHAAHS
jgi:hypothetical protein